jgi:hypothetical protein
VLLSFTVCAKLVGCHVTSQQNKGQHEWYLKIQLENIDGGEEEALAYIETLPFSLAEANLAKCVSVPILSLKNEHSGFSPFGGCSVEAVDAPNTLLN